jgi:putative lipoprotein
VRYESGAGMLPIFSNQDQSLLTYHAVAAASAAVTGTVSYRERIVLPSGATVTIRLLDISRQDAPVIVLAEQIITTTGQQVPIPFSLTYDPTQINPNCSYSVRAEISANGQRLFTTTDAYLVITQGHPTNVDVLVQRSGR